MCLAFFMGKDVYLKQGFVSVWIKKDKNVQTR